MLRFAANLSFMYGEYAFPDRFAAAARDAFTAVEYLFPYEYPAAPIGGMAAIAWFGSGTVQCPAGKLGRRANEGWPACRAGRRSFAPPYILPLTMRKHSTARRVHVMAGLGPGSRSTFVSNLAWAAALAQPAGVELLIEPINPRDMPGYFLNRQDEAHAIVDEVGNPALKVQMDLYHCQIVEGDVSMKLRKYLAEKSVGHIQIASVPARNEPDQGELNYDYVLDLIDELGFDGWIGCEYRPKGGTSEGLTWLKRRL